MGMTPMELNGKMYHDIGRASDGEARCYYKAAERGNVAAQFDLGQMYYNGHGVSKNDQEAYVWFLIARTNCKEDETLLNRIEKAITDIEQNLTPKQKQEAQEMATRQQDEFEQWQKNN